jgi:rubrerythrin
MVNLDIRSIMNYLNHIAGLDLPHHPNNSLQRILSTALPRVDRSTEISPINNYWNAQFFQLDRVKLFQDASEMERLAILQLANRSLLEEAYFIEKAGVGYMAKMVLLAESIEERMLYGLFTTDETIHLSQISSLLPDREPDSRDNPFLNLLTEVVAETDKTLLLFVIQVVLEGWGLSHYHRLAKGCDDRSISALFSGFLQAEARHHGTGATLFAQTQMSISSQNAIVEVLNTFLHMVQVGPQNLLIAIERIKGQLSRSQKIQILTELDTETHSNERLQILRSLMRVAAAAPILQTLEDRHAFTPLSPQSCI